MPKHLHPLGALNGRAGLLRVRIARQGSHLAVVSQGCCHRSSNRHPGPGRSPSPNRLLIAEACRRRHHAPPAEAFTAWRVPFRLPSRSSSFDPTAADPLRGPMASVPRRTQTFPSEGVLPEGSWPTPSHPSVRRGPLEPGVCLRSESVWLPFRVSVRVGLPGSPPIGDCKRTRRPHGAQAEIEVGFRVSMSLFASRTDLDGCAVQRIQEREISASFPLAGADAMSYGSWTAEGRPKAERRSREASSERLELSLREEHQERREPREGGGAS